MAQENHRRRDNAREPAADGAARLQLIETAGFPDYALLDSGGGRKLERFGPIVVDRPEPQALWTPAAPEREWRHAHAVFSGDDEEDKGRWRIDKPVPESWPVKVGAATVLCRLASFRHMGLFPEQMPHWEWMLARLAEKRAEPPRVLNLFAYTGAASLIAAAAGAHVTHVDASKKAIAWAKENQAASGLEAAPIRWMLDDASKFVAREVRRGKTYDVILVDPPKFGRGPDGEVWDLFTSLPPLMKDCAALLAPGAAMVLTVYAIRASSLAFDQLCREVLQGRGGTFQSGELAIRETERRAGGAGVALSRAGARNDVGAEGDHQPAERPREGDPRAGDAQGAQGDGAVRRRGHVDPRHRARQRLRAADARLSRRECRERHRAGARRVGAGSRRRMPRGVGGGARQARLEGQSAEHARRLRAALGRSRRRPPPSRATPYGWRWRKSATRETSAPSSAPPMRSAPPVSCSSGRAAIPIRTNACARRWAPSSRCRWRA